MRRLEQEERFRLASILRTVGPDRLVKAFSQYEVDSTDGSDLFLVCHGPTAGHSESGMREVIDLVEPQSGDACSVPDLLLALFAHETQCHP